MITFEEFRKKALSNPEVKKEYNYFLNKGETMSEFEKVFGKESKDWNDIYDLIGKMRERI